MKFRRIVRSVFAGFLTAAMVVMSANLPQFTQKVYAVMMIAEPTEFISNTEADKGFKAEDFNDIYNLYKPEDGEAGIAQKVYFGKNGSDAQSWYIVGLKDSQLVLICDLDKPMKNNQTYNPREETRSYEDEVYGVITVDPNFYGTSDVRAYLNGDALDNFTTAEKTLMLRTQNSSSSGGLRYWFEDILFVPYRIGDIIGAASNSLYINLKNIVFKYGYTFWLRERAMSGAMSGFVVDAFSYNTMTESCWMLGGDGAMSYSVAPIFHLDLSSVIFASTATAASASATLSDGMTFRIDGTGKLTSSASATSTRIVVDTPTTGEFLYVQWNDGEEKVKAFQPTATKNAFTSTDGIPTDLTNCKIWIEKTVATENLTYANEAHRHSFADGTCKDCEMCEELFNSGEHDYSVVADDEKHMCSVCKGVASHEYTENAYQIDDSGKHYQICEVCGGESEHVACTPGTPVKENIVEATCGSTGSHDEVVYCTVCNQKLSTTPKVDPATGEHKYAAQPYLTDDTGKHYQICEVCGGESEHVACTPGESVNENIVAPTCGSAGSHDEVVYCTVCNQKLSTTPKVDPATGNHKYTSEITKEPTKVEDGIKTYTCSVCNHTYEEALDKLLESGKPYIKNDTDERGLTDIADVVDNTPAGDTITVVMNDATTVPADVFEAAKGKDVTVVFDMGDGIKWTVNGKDITGTSLKDINLSITKGTEAGKVIPVDVINEITGDNTSVNLSLAHNGDFGFKAVLTVNLEAKNKGLMANLFYYNPSTKALEYVCAAKIDDNGDADLTFTHASDYTIVISNKDMKPSSTPGNPSDIPTGDRTNTFIFVLLAIMGLAVATVVIGRKRRVME